MLWADLEERVIDLDSPAEVAGISRFLAGFALTFDTNIEYTVAFLQQGNIVATGSLSGEVLRNIAIADGLQGQGIAGLIVSKLIQEASRRGTFHYFIFTKTDTAHLFTELGFKTVMQIPGYVTLLESGLGTIESYCSQLKQEVRKLPAGSRAAVVVNCNPFTLGHKALIAKAAGDNSFVVVFVLREERSAFPFDIRMKLVKAGLAEYNNILVLPGSKYIISTATFPAYFIKGQEAVKAQTLLDANIFAKYIAPALGITSRYLGEEPYCEVTGVYNKTLAEILPEQGLAVHILPRATVGGEVISASKVREYIRAGKWEQLKEMVPSTTYDYLKSEETATVIEKIKNIKSRH